VHKQLGSLGAEEKAESRVQMCFLRFTVLMHHFFYSRNRGTMWRDGKVCLGKNKQKQIKKKPLDFIEIRVQVQAWTKCLRIQRVVV
jgi:hypothetical protein